MHDVLWENALSTLEGRIKPHNFEMWLRPIHCKGIDGGRIMLTAPSKWIQEWFQDNYQSIVLDALRTQTNQDFEIVFEVRETEAAPAEEAAPSFIAPGDGPVPIKVVAAEKSEPHSDLLAKYTFEAFVVGPSNQLAHAASRAVAEVPAGKYNPLFIYGGVGLGKTHLVHAIGHRLREKHPQWRILYLKTETFMNEYINSLRNGKIDEFRRKYRERCDVLLMDDIQFLQGKDRTQDEFFHTFNSLFESHRQIVLTADKYPHEIPDLEDRLRSRFQSGLIADIQPPELETRIAILKKKADLDEIPLPDEVASYLATNIKSNVRELEGLLLRVAAFSGLQEQPITIEFAKETLKNFLTQAAHSLTVEAVQKEVANYFNVKLADLKSPKRHQAIARPRQIAMYLARKLCKSSYPELGQRFGGKDHTTVLSACRKIESLVQSDPKTRHTVEELERHLSQ
ncbi:MAG TPA: chromosomal replication initiator protein DnaA [Polyangia bacterium]|nr:chromosomal replication initiator protein DnaA [Polyangia bacterium]